MKWLLGMLALGSLALTLPAAAQTHEVVTRTGIEFVEHDGVKLAGDLYLPKGRDKAPVLIAAYGGGWQIGNRSSYRSGGRISPSTALRCSRSATGCRSPAPRPIRRPCTT